MNLLDVLKVKVVGLGSKAFSVLADQVTSVLFMVVTAVLAKRIMKMVTTNRDVTPPDMVL